jgi:hypothetical protein
LPLEEDEGKNRWAGPLVGFSRERRGGGLGWNRPKARKVLSFLKKSFLFSVFQTLCYFTKDFADPKLFVKT